ncbi:dipeptidase [Tepidibacillus decaturensis]|uniref:Peptidase n=1 Tax=Tepidibacillus decaturensis TaxID=1413211 RepID=A0A135L3N4_9BACI|nr:dipeptidase [Tepidibacillus decaturensis]KXG43463.1 hypothetical protein U473_05130 [Tepidibacillus decaturensis]
MKKTSRKERNKLIIDAHTDVLWKMLNYPDIDFYEASNQLDVNFPNMEKGNIDVQVFAIFVSTYSKTSRFSIAMQSIDDFYEKILRSNQIQLATNFKQIESGLKLGRKIALLSLEGAEAIEGDLRKLRAFYRLGVRAMGLTWNHANEVADGVGESRNGGLTSFGRLVVEEMNRLGMMIDVSHLAETGFWEVIELTKAPIIASHSNSRQICNHPRNLTDEQIQAIIENGGMIGVTFVRDFTAHKEDPNIEDLVKHIEHIAELGGISNIGLGSDFDGATPVVGLENASRINCLTNVLSKHYPDDQVQGILGKNWLNYYKKIL